MIYRHAKPESFMSKVLNTIFKIIGAKNILGKKLKDLEGFKNDPDPITKSVKQTCEIKEETFRERALWTLSPKNKQSDKTIFYIHGGGYVLNISSMLWNYLAKVVKETNATILVTNYPLAPQSNAEEAFAYLQELYEKLIDRNEKKEVLFLADSAGAGLAISFAQYLNDVNLPQPGKIILSSPWLDISLTNPNISDVIPKDNALEIKSLQKKISMFMGTSEIFLSDARKLIKKLEEESIPFNYFEYPKMLHCWILLPLPESKAALSQIMELINE